MQQHNWQADFMLWPLFVFICITAIQNSACGELTLSPGGPGGPSLPAVPWNTQNEIHVILFSKRSVVQSTTHKEAWNQCEINISTLGPGFPVGPLAPRAPRGPYRETNNHRSQTQEHRLVAVSKTVRLQRIRRGGSRTYRWPSLSSWTRFTCNTLVNKKKRSF